MTVFVVLGHVHYIYHKFVLVNISCNVLFYFMSTLPLLVYFLYYSILNNKHETQY